MVTKLCILVIGILLGYYATLLLPVLLGWHVNQTAYRYAYSYAYRYAYRYAYNMTELKIDQYLEKLGEKLENDNA